MLKERLEQFLKLLQSKRLTGLNWEVYHHMRITEINVTELFGLFNHHIPLNVEERITIIYGLNGVGKTILLKMISGLFNGRYDELRRVPFRKFEVKFDDGSRVWVDKIQLEEQPTLFDDPDMTNRPDHQITQITISLAQANSKEDEQFSLQSMYKPISASKLERLLPIERVRVDKWLYLPTGETLSVDEILSRFGHELPKSLRREPNWWIEFRKSVSIRLVETQRLLSHQTSDSYRRSSKLVPVVDLYSEELAQSIKQKLAESATLSQSLDRTFPARLLEHLGQSDLSSTELTEKLNQLEKKRKQLQEVGLLDKADDTAFLPNKAIEDNAKDVLSVYVKDVEKKLGVFDDIADKIELFLDIINQRFAYTQMTISQQVGFTFNLNDTLLHPSSLSSGEQHEVVLLYELLFKVKPNTLILIDEPELSLHVAWQHNFLRDLQKIIALTSLDILIATHSPQIIHDRWDLTIALEEPEAT